MPWHDPIVAEIRRYREDYAARFNFDLAAICADLRKRQQASGRKVVRRPPKPPKGHAERTTAEHAAGG